MPSDSTSATKQSFELGRERSALDAPLGDSPPLPPGVGDQLDEVVKDQQYRRLFRTGLVLSSMSVLVVLLWNLTYVIWSTTGVYTKAVSAHEAAATKLLNPTVEMASSAASTPASGTEAKSKPDAGEKSADEKVRHQRPVFGEMRDALLPIVFMVSVLAASVVVILATALKASFAPAKAAPDKADGDAAEQGGALPLPLLEAVRGLIEAVGSIRK